VNLDPRFLQLPNQFPARGGFGQILDDHPDGNAEAPSRFFRQLLQLVPVAGDQNQIKSAFGKPFCQLGPDARRGAGDQDRFSNAFPVHGFTLA